MPVPVHRMERMPREPLERKVVVEGPWVAAGPLVV